MTIASSYKADHDCDVHGPFKALAELTALLAQRLAASTIFAMFSLDAFTVRAVIVVVVHLSIFGRVLWGICVICGYFCHLYKSPPLHCGLLNGFVPFGKLSFGFGHEFHVYRRFDRLSCLE